MTVLQEKLTVTGLVLVVLAFAMLPSVGGCETDSQEAAPQKAENAVLVIGDGMGEAQRTAIRLTSVGLRGELAMDSLPYSGLINTSPEDPQAVVTDSAAGGTAIATGVKTYNEAVGVGPDKVPVETILEKASKAGKATGLVTTDQVTSATPAAFAAHVTSREAQGEIARQYIEESKPDVILGGGENQWYPAGEEGAFPGARPEEDSTGSDGNLIELAQGAGYDYVSSEKELESAEGPKVLGLFANARMFRPEPEGEGADYDPLVALPEMTKKALDTLSEDPEGFFLIVEEEAIDEMGHENNAPLMIEAGQQLDKAVEVVKSFAERNPDTLILVTADHETGGLAIEETEESDYSDEPDSGNSTEDGPFRVKGSGYRFMVDWTTMNHTGVSVPVTAMGPGAERLVGIHENTYVHEVMVRALSL